MSKKISDDQNELFVVVDKNDRIVGHQRRRECHRDKSIIHRAIGVVIFNSKNKILLQKRSQTKDLFPSHYTIACTGHSGEGENYLDSAQRELQEELGISREIPLRFLKKVIIPYEKETHMLAIFTGKNEGPFKPNPKEVEKVAFFSKYKIKKLFVKGELLLTPYGEGVLKVLGII